MLRRGIPMRYKIYQSKSIEELKDAELIGGANSCKEACKVIQDYLAVNSFHQEQPYWRFLMCEHATIIDYGSYSKYMAIVPPLSMEEIS
jgi:hypothetical protein